MTYMAKEQKRQKKSESSPHPGLKPLCKETTAAALKCFTGCCNNLTLRLQKGHFHRVTSASASQQADANSCLNSSPLTQFFQTCCCRWFESSKDRNDRHQKQCPTHPLLGPADSSPPEHAAGTSSRSGSNTGGTEGSLKEGTIGKK